MWNRAEANLRVLHPLVILTSTAPRPQDGGMETVHAKSKRLKFKLQVCRPHALLLPEPPSCPWRRSPAGPPQARPRPTATRPGPADMLPWPWAPAGQGADSHRPSACSTGWWWGVPCPPTPTSHTPGAMSPTAGKPQTRRRTWALQHQPSGERPASLPGAPWRPLLL